MNFVKNGHINHKEQKDYAKDILPREAVDPVMDFIVACRKRKDGSILFLTFNCSCEAYS